MFSFWRQKKIDEGDDDDDSETAVNVDAVAAFGGGEKEQDRGYLPSAADSSSTSAVTQSVSYPIDKDPSASIRLPLTFEDALYQTCLRHHSLHSTPLQVSRHFHDIQLPRRHQLLAWSAASASSDPDGEVSTTTAAFLTKYADQFGWEKPPPTRPRTSIGSYLASLVVSPADTDDVTDDDEDSARELPVQPTDALLCEALVLEALRHLLGLVRTSPTTPTNPSRAWCLQVGGHDTEPFTFRHWLLQDAPPSVLQSPPSMHVNPLHIGAVLASLSLQDTLWLCRLLEHAGVAKVVSRPESKVLVLAQREADPAAGDPGVEQQLALLDLLLTRHRLELLAQASEDKVSTLQRQALQHMRADRLPSAKAVLQRSKVHRQQVDRAHQALLTVEQSLNLLQNSASNQQVLRAVQQANQVLQARRIDVEEMYDVLEDLSEHVEEANRMDDTIASALKTAGVGLTDDEDLLQELNLLTLQDRGAASIGGPQDTERLPIQEPSNFPTPAVAPSPNESPVEGTLVQLSIADPTEAASPVAV